MRSVKYSWQFNACKNVDRDMKNNEISDNGQDLQEFVERTCNHNRPQVE